MEQKNNCQLSIINCQLFQGGNKGAYRSFVRGGASRFLRST